MNFLEFQKKVFPYNSPFERKDIGKITNLIKFMALRVSYFLYRIGISANTLDLFGVIATIPAFVLCYRGLIELEMFLFLSGYLILAVIIFIDFIDGPLSNSHEYKYKAGGNLDNLCPDIILIGGLILIGILTKNLYLTALCWVNSVFFITFKTSTIENIPVHRKWLLKLLSSRFSLLSVRVFIAFLFPLTCIIYIINQGYGQIFARIIVITFAFLSFLWIFSTFEDKVRRKE